MSGSDRAGTAPDEEGRLPLPLVGRGKVREIYEAGPDHLVLLATDRVSAFDVVLSRTIPRKGEVLTMLTAWWLTTLDGVPGLRHHLVSADPREMERRVPVLAEARGAWERRSMLVHRTDPLPVECVVRGYLAGSAWKEYRESGTLAGEPLPPGLRQADPLEAPLFSPATKAERGAHDENIPATEVERRLGPALAQRLEELSLELFRGATKVSSERGLILADTKFEFGLDPRGDLLLIDEVLTPDSSRFWPAEEYRPGRSPVSLDKQPIRDYLDALPDWDRTPPPPDLPSSVAEAATGRYLEVFRRLTGVELEDYDPPAPRAGEDIR